MSEEVWENDLALAGVALAANVLQLAGVYWDVGTHHAFGRESFWSPPHLAIYSGVALALVTASAGLPRGRGLAGRASRPVRLGRYALALLGPAIQVLAAPIDELWHLLFGKDVSIWSPPHLLGVLGGMLGVLGWIMVVVRPARVDTIGRARRALAFAFSVLLLTGALFALGEYDHDQARREPWLYPLLTGFLAPWILVTARTWLGWRWAATTVAVGYTVVRFSLALGVWAVGLPWMGVPPQIVAGAILLDVLCGRRGPGAAGVAFGLAFTVTDYPMTYALSGRSWGLFEWMGTLAAAAAAGWASARFGHTLSMYRWDPMRSLSLSEKEGRDEGAKQVHE